jgi:hypothetical protein
MARSSYTVLSTVECSQGGEQHTRATHPPTGLQAAGAKWRPSGPGLPPQRLPVARSWVVSMRRMMLTSMIRCDKTVTSPMCIFAYNIRSNIHRHRYKHHDNHSLPTQSPESVCHYHYL